METLSQILGGLGILGLAAAILLAAVMLFILPWWAIIDCIRSRRDNDTKTLLVIGLVVTWGVGSLVYGLFFTGSRALRLFTILSVVAPLVILVPSAISLGTGARMGAKLQQEKDREEIDELTAQFKPSELAHDALEPFVGIHFVQADSRLQAATLVAFTLDGPEHESARDIDRDVRHLAHDAGQGRYFALTSHDFGTITPSSGRFTKVEVDPSLGDFSWPKGLAYDSTARKVIIMTSHVYTRFYKYDPQTSDWERLPSELRDLPLLGLAYSPVDDCLYALEHESREPFVKRIHRFNTSGASLGFVAVHPAIPVSRDQREFFQLHYSSGRLVLLVPPPGDRANRIVVVDPVTGEVAVPMATDLSLQSEK